MATKRLTLDANSIMRLAIFIAALFATLSSAQTPRSGPAESQNSGVTKRPAFEVASIKPSSPKDLRVYITPAGDRLFATGMSVKRLVSYAYGIQEFQVFGATGWMDSERWTLEAKAGEQDLRQNAVSDPKAPSIFSLMVQSLLEDRFHVKLHRETQDLPVYELVVAKGGLKIKLAPDQTPISPGAQPMRADGRGRGLLRGSFGSSRGKFEGVAIPISLFVQYLTPHVQRKIIDKTNLSGLYDFQFTYSQSFDSVSPEDSTLNQAPSPFTDLREQLGLTLLSARGLVEVIVIDSAIRPTPNQ